MRTTDPGDAARIELLLAELRLPAIKLVWASLAAQADKEGWPAGRFLAACRAATGLRRGGVRAGVGCARQSHVRPMRIGGRQMQWAIFSISAARSPMTTHAAIVLPVVTRGIMDASAIRRFLSPYTLSSPSTTDVASRPILAVLLWCQ